MFIHLPFVSVESLGNSFVSCFSSDISKAKKKERCLLADVCLTKSAQLRG